MASERKQTSQVVEISKRKRKSTQCSQQVPPENLAFWIMEDLWGHLGKLEEFLVASAPPSLLHLQVQVLGGAGSRGGSDPVMLLL